MAGKATAAVQAEDTVLTMERVFEAPRERVFRAWTDPQCLSQWWGPKGMTCPSVEIEARPGGRWRTCMLGTDGVERWVRGVYREVEPPERLVFTWAWEEDGVPGHETLVSIDFRDRGGTTEMLFRHELFPAAEARDLHRQGWTSSFECLTDYLAEEE